MAIEIEVTGTGKFAGHKSSIGSYSYDEESTPITPGDSSGGVGQLSFDVLEDSDQTILLYRDGIRLTDSFSGAVAGVVDSIAVNDGVATISGRSRLGLLNTTRTVLGGATTLGTLITRVLNAGGITTGISIDASLSSISVIAPNYTGDLWIYLKDIAVAYQIEVALLNDTVTIRPLRQRIISPLNIESESWEVSDVQLAQSVEVAYYNYSTVADSLVYPKGGWNSDVQVYQVDSAQTLAVDIPVDFYLSSVKQPIVQATVSKTYAGPDSVYSVAGNDGLPIPAAQWSDNGGSVTLSLKDDGTTIQATIVGANIPNLAPFRLAVSSGPSDYYSTLRIVGSGVSFDRQIFTQPTGLTASDTPTLVGITVDNPLISTFDAARDAAMRAIVPFCLPSRTYSATARVVNRSFTDGPEVIYPTFQVYNESLPVGYTFGNFNTEWSGKTFQQFTDAQGSTVVNDFKNQAFGNVAGARVKYRDAWYRISSANSTQDGIRFSANFDNLFSDFNTQWAGKTFTDFNGQMAGLSFTDFALIPMRSA